MIIKTAAAVNPRDDLFGTSAHLNGPGAGVFRSLDDGLTWSSLGLQGTNVLSLTVRPDGFLFAGSSAGRVFRRRESTLRE